MHQAGKPLGFMWYCTGDTAEIFDFPLRLTIGTDIDTAEVLEEMGAEACAVNPVDDIVVDEDNKIVPTPAYMLAQNIAEAAERH